MSTDYRRTPAIDPDEVMDCTECSVREVMRRTYDLTNGLDRKCGEIWVCAECGAEYIDEW